MRPDLVLILPDLEPLRHVETPYGAAPVGELDGFAVLVRGEGVEGRALIWAAKEMGARWVLAGEAVQPVSPLLEEGDLVVPADLIDLTKLRPFTFFVGKGYGFIKLNPPFCPDLMTALLAEARKAQPRSFRGATYVGAEGPREATPAELRMFRQWGGDVVGGSLLPEAYLARELELHYAALTVVGEATAPLRPALLAAARRSDLGSLAPCGCAETMRFMKEQGVIGEDWKEW
ncbi:MAG: MTAP family purine nucleoside phosphorylase [Bacillota bacterium]